MHGSPISSKPRLSLEVASKKKKKIELCLSGFLSVRVPRRVRFQDERTLAVIFNLRGRMLYVSKQGGNLVLLFFF